MPLILITGATGAVARGVLPFLEKHFELRLLAIDAAGDDPRRIQADILHRPALARAMNGVDGVLHLAVAAGHSGTFEEEAFNDLRFDVNVKGTYHVFEAARRLRVRRVVLVSSVMVTWGYGLLEPGKVIPGNAPPIPVGTYAMTKTLAEGLARYYAADLDQEGNALSAPRRGSRRGQAQDVPKPMEVLTLRIAAPLDLTDPELPSRPVRPQQVPLPDLAQAFRLALTVPLERHEVVTIVGDSSQRLWDLEPAKRVLGYQPQYYLDDLGLKFALPFAVEQQ
jgi:NAD(P)-dependent dehydrogenase (short-subunit alcohol dehydrogenase family)